MKTTRLLPWILPLSGTLTYNIGLWRVCPLLSGKGYFLGALMVGMFVMYTYQRAVNLNQIDERFASVYQMMALITIGLLLVGVWSAPLAPSEAGLYPAAFFICSMGQFLLQRSCNRVLPGDIQLTGLHVSIRCNNTGSSRLPANVALKIYGISNGDQFLSPIPLVCSA